MIDANIINLWETTGKYLLILLPIILPLMLFYAFWIIRFRWLTMKYVEAQTPCLLEIKLPKEITKSPAAMEIFFSHLGGGGAGNWGEAFLDGKTRPWFSCELVSISGVVKFFIYCSQAKNKNTVETQLYAQYPNLEIFEVEDYTKNFCFDPENYPLSGIQYKLEKADPFPIKTYIDYGLDKDQKDEYKIDPITSVIEYLGSLKKGENAWIQILIQKHEKESWKHGELASDTDPKKAKFFQKIIIFIFGKSKNLKDEIKEEIEKIKKSTLPEGDDDKIIKIPNPTKSQLEIIAALERNSTKVPYDCMIRSIYISEKNSFNPINIGGLVGGLKQYGSNNLNSFKPDVSADVKEWRKDWARFLPFLKKSNDKEILRIKKDLLYAYKLRSYFCWPYKNYGKKGEKGKPFILTTEELATIFHFPSGIVSQTPTLQRIESKKSEAPSNLPV
ncbi:MAG: hypothetical protein ABH971_01040 [bacterium]